MTLWHFIIFLLACGAVLFGIYYVAPRLIASERVRRWLGGGKFWLLALSAFVCVHLRLNAAEAALHLERRGSEVILKVTGGTSNVQYQIWTAPNPAQDVAATNWYYWRRAYSATFHPYAEILVYGENTSKQPQRFFQIRGILPDS